MKKMTAHFAALLIALFALASCSKSSDTIVTDNMPNYVYGNALVVDQYGNKSSDVSNIQVTITDGTYNKVVVTDAVGGFSLDRVPVGNYSVRFKKDGLAETQSDLKVEAGKNRINVKSPVLGPKANHQVYFQSIAMTDGGLRIDLVSNPAPSKTRPVSYRIFLGNDGPADHQVYTAQARFSTQTGGEIIILTKDQLTTMGIRPGQVNLTVYPDTFNTTESTVNGLTLFPTLHDNAPQRYSFNF